MTIEGRAHEYVRAGDEGSKATFRFCPICGATVYFDNDVSVYGARRHPWTTTHGLALEELD